MLPPSSAHACAHTGTHTHKHTYATHERKIMRMGTQHTEQAQATNMGSSQHTRACTQDAMATAASVRQVSSERAALQVRACVKGCTHSPVLPHLQPQEQV